MTRPKSSQPISNPPPIRATLRPEPSPAPPGPAVTRTTMPARGVVGCSGGVAADTAIEVCRRLVDAGVHVAPVLTDDAQRFVGALTFSALASEPARTSLFAGAGAGGGAPT